MNHDSAFQCGTCLTVVRFDEEHPVQWYEPEELQRLREEAREWEREFPDGTSGPIIGLLDGRPSDWPEHTQRIWRLRLFLRHSWGNYTARIDSVDIRRFDCPTCGSLVGAKDAVEPLPTADEIAEKVLEKMHERSRRPWESP